MAASRFFAKTTSAWVIFALFLSFGVLMVRPANAWICTRVTDNYGNASGPALYWENRNISYAFNANATSQLSAQTAFATIRQSFAVWQNSTLRSDQTAGCSASIDPNSATSTDITFSELAQTTQTSVGYNYLKPDTNLNLIIFRDTDWRYASSGPTSDVVALATLTYNAITGSILDADIEFNSANCQFTVSDTDIQYDLMNAATHEIGHMLGFAHSKTADSAMYGQTSQGDISKRELTCDDAAILWFRYPASDPNNGTCPRNQVDDSCGLCAAPSVLVYDANFQVIEEDDGMGGCNCRSSSASGLTLLGTLLCLACYRCYRRQAA